MHRSGTSLVAQVLRECGLDLGPDDELLPPNEENREGFWENRHFVALNDELLSSLGGSWSSPPELPQGWETAAELEPLRERGRELVERFGVKEPWGWKDPRNSLTMPFWRQIVPDVKVVHCVRHPVEVAASLAQRGEPSGDSRFDLWFQYNRALLDAIAPDRRIVARYDRFFDEPEREVRRLVDFLDLRSSSLQVAHATTAVNEFVRNHRAETVSEAGSGAPAEVLSYYDELVRAADSGGPWHGNGRVGRSSTMDSEPERAGDEEAGSQAPFPYTRYDDSPESTHNMVVDLVPEGANVLEFGCATGYMSEVLRQRRRATVTGIEISEAAAEVARARANRVVVGDAETLDFGDAFSSERFDAILFADVLEHLRDPATLLGRVRPLLSDRGAVIASVPNIAHSSVRLALLGGDFRPRQTGLLDETHLHFFTRESLQDMFEEAGYAITRTRRRRLSLDESEIAVSPMLSAAVSEIVLADPEASTYQFVVAAVPSGSAAELHALRDKLRRAREELNELRPGTERLSAQLAALREEHANLQLAHEAVRRRMVAERAAFAEHVRELEELGLAAVAERQSFELAERENEIARLRQELDVIANSRSVRYTAPVRGLFAFLRRGRQ
jgi:O-antigen biosynthesis protein